MHSIGELKSLVEDEIRKLKFNTSPQDLYAPISYMLSLEAKRLRPVMLLCGCELFDGELNNAIMPAVGIEVFHNFTLLHDDIMDKAPLRRSKPTVHEKWNTNVAILSGDTMFVKACQLMMMTREEMIRPVLELFYQTAVEVCEGQQMDMDFEKQHDVSIDDYISMITKKTAVLLAASLKTGAIIAGAPSIDADHLYEFGKNTGIAFQLKDDILDAFGDDKKFGKMKGGDIVANKKTFLLLKAIEMSGGEDGNELRKWIKDTDSDPLKKSSAVTALYEKMGVPAIAEAEMEKYFNAALYHLDQIKIDNDRKRILREAAQKLMVREV